MINDVPRKKRCHRGVSAAIIAATLILSGCSNHHQNKLQGLPNPARGKVAPFSLGKLSEKYNVNQATSDTSSGRVISDRHGNVYMTDGAGSDSDILKMNPRGGVILFARVQALGAFAGMTTSPHEGIVVGGTNGIFRVDSHERVKRIDADFHRPIPLGTRPDGSLVVQDESTFWSLKGTRKTKIYSFGRPPGKIATAVDVNGTIYAGTGKTMEHLLVLPPGKAARTIAIRGNLPGTNTAISSQAAITMTPAQGGGFYARTVRDPAKGPSAFGYVVRVHPTGEASVLIRAANKNSLACHPGKQYPALKNGCSMPWFVVQSGKKILSMGSSSDTEIPAIALRADAK